MKPRHKRAAIAVGALAAVAVAAGLVLNAFNSNLVFYFTPTQVAANEAPSGRTFRIGGLVQAGSVARDGLRVRFVVTDIARNVPVRYDGVLPDLFREGKGVVVQGRLASDGTFVAHEVLAKHDENYMPPQAADAVQQAAKDRQRGTATVQGPGK